MNSVEQLMAEYIANGEVNLTNEELELVDFKVYEYTGKHIEKYDGVDMPRYNLSTVPTIESVTAPVDEVIS